MSSRVTKKERNLIKGALRRVFSRSELRQKAINAALVKDYTDPNRKRVTKWGRCTVCKQMHPLYKMAIDHLVPVVPVDSSLEQMTFDELVDRIWCDERNLQAICESCHSEKSKAETKERTANKRLKKGK